MTVVSGFVRVAINGRAVSRPFAFPSMVSLSEVDGKVLAAFHSASDALTGARTPLPRKGLCRFGERAS